VLIVTPLPTQFAPAERASDAQIQQDADSYMSETLVTSMLDAVPNVLLVLNQERQTVFANEACMRLLNLPDRNEALGQRPGELVGCAHAAETEGGCGTTEFCRNCGAAKAILSSLKGVESIQECRITLRNGEALDLQASAKPLEMNNSHFTVFTLTDISGEKRRRVLERIFFHDVLNTAGILSMSTDIIKRHPSEAPELIDDMFRVSHQLIDEIQSQRDLAAAESGELAPKPTTFSAADFIENLVQQYTHHQIAEGRQLQFVPNNQTLTFTTDRTLLGRVIGKMVKNALEAAHPGDTVTASYSFDATVVTFAVHNPTHMPENVQLQVFNRSFSTKGAGRGLGTYSMKLLSERYLGGQVRFESTKEDGTTFYATYPIEYGSPTVNSGG
jgi:hypothetical protein